MINQKELQSLSQHVTKELNCYRNVFISGNYCGTLDILSAVFNQAYDDAVDNVYEGRKNYEDWVLNNSQLLMADLKSRVCPQAESLIGFIRQIPQEEFYYALLSTFSNDYFNRASIGITEMENFDFLSQVACYGIALAFLERGVIQEGFLVKDKVNLFLRKETPMKKNLRLLQRYSRDVQVSIVPIKEKVRKIVENEVINMKAEKITVMRNNAPCYVTAWSVIEDKFVDEISDNEVEKYLLEINKDSNEIIQKDTRQWKKAKYMLAGELWKEQRYEELLTKEKEIIIEEIMYRDIRYLYETNPNEWSKLDEVEKSDVYCQFLNIRNQWSAGTCNKTGEEAWKNNEYRRAILPLLIRKKLFGREKLIQVAKPEAIIELLEKYSNRRKEELGSDLGTLFGEKQMLKYVKSCVKNGRPIKFNIPVCPTRWPVRLTYKTPLERAGFFDSDPVASDVVIRMEYTQELMFDLIACGAKVLNNFIVFATDESDYLRIEELDPWLQDSETVYLLKCNLSSFTQNVDMFVRAVLGDSDVGDCKENFKDISKLERIKTEVDTLARKVEEKLGRDSNRIIKKRAEAKRTSFLGDGFYSLAMIKTGAPGISEGEARSMAIRQIATYSLQYNDMSQEGIAVDTTSMPTKDRLRIYTLLPGTKIINPYPKL